MNYGIVYLHTIPWICQAVVFVCSLVCVCFLSVVETAAILCIETANIALPTHFEARVGKRNCWKSLLGHTSWIQ